MDRRKRVTPTPYDTPVHNEPTRRRTVSRTLRSQLQCRTRRHLRQPSGPHPVTSQLLDRPGRTRRRPTLANPTDHTSCIDGMRFRDLPLRWQTSCHRVRCRGGATRTFGDVSEAVLKPAAPESGSRPGPVLYGSYALSLPLGTVVVAASAMDGPQSCRQGRRARGESISNVSVPCSV